MNNFPKKIFEPYRAGWVESSLLNATRHYCGLKKKLLMSIMVFIFNMFCWNNLIYPCFNGIPL
jgi:hypothetical protein